MRRCLEAAAGAGWALRRGPGGRLRPGRHRGVHGGGPAGSGCGGAGRRPRRDPRDARRERLSSSAIASARPFWPVLAAPRTTAPIRARAPGLVLTFAFPSSTYDRIRLPGNRDAVAATVGRGPDLRGHRGPVPPQVLLPRDASLPLGGHPRRPRPELLHHRRRGALQADEGLQRPAPDRLGRPRPSGRERRDQARDPSGEVDPRQHRRDEAPAPAPRLQLPLEPRDRHLRPGVLPLEPVVLPPDAGAGDRLPGQGARSTGARAARPSSPTSRPRGGRAGAAAASSSSATWSSGSFGSPPTRTSCSTTWRSFRPGPTASSSSSATGSDAPRAPRWTSPCPGPSRSASSRRGSTRSSARRSWSWPPSIPASTSSWPTAPAKARAAVAKLRSQDRRARLEGKVEKEGVFTGRHAVNPFSGERIPDLGRQLRPHGLRDRRDHGGPGPRPARLRVRAQVRDPRPGRDPARRRDPRRRFPRRGLRRPRARS